ncbi:MAG TPA: DNA polymerase III subunit gamma/tau [Verrucomicrobiota bacterium]|nr:DNA polymerase III subunit gamma/tau [Verrucomicrobiota bacterium]HRZ38665.1 DNA polymerase III subunit gamma/tau [Candidatus Paceibacterota bacterium]HRZ56633.1 DNA polymerase III subunit gamma/tau [Candidatus Paceibacterota bacterium]
MSYQVIARKYRPQRFADVVGQEHVTQTLANAVRQNRIAHAYLFCGPRGTGKTTIARIFAKCLNCTNGPSVDFLDEDSKCIEIAEGRSIDVLEIDGASNNGVEQVRELRETVKYAPASSAFKIYIIDEVHMLSAAAFNALLKTLEEPPAHVKFMFATTDPQKVLPTILSRCQRFDLRRIPTALIVRHLEKIARAEGVQVEGAALYAIARGADGGMRDAESTLDQLISFCGNTIGEPDVLSMFGLTAQAQILALANAMLGGQADVVLRELDALAQAGKDLGRLLTDLLGHFRNLLVYQVSRGDLDLLEVSEAEAAALKEQAPRIDTEPLTRMLEILTDTEARLGDAVSKKITLEVALLKTIQARSALSLDAVLQRLNQLRQESVSPNEPAPGGRAETTAPPRADVASPAPDLIAAPAASRASALPANDDAPPVSAPPGDEVARLAPAGDDLETLWNRLLEAVGRVSPFTRSYLLKAFPASFEGGMLVIGFDPEFADYLPLVDNARNQALLQTKLRELGLAEAQVRFAKLSAPPAQTRKSSPAAPEPALAAPSESPAPPAAPKTPGAQPKAQETKSERRDPSQFKDDPLIKQALEIFRGQIVEVRA